MAVFGDERWNRNRYDSTGDFDLLQGFGSVASWGANHGIGKTIYGGFDWEDPRSMNRWSQMPLLGNIFGARRDEIAQKQNDDYFAELGRWMGFDPDEVPYSVRAGMLGTGRSVGGALSQSVLGMYSPELRKWKR